MCDCSATGASSATDSGDSGDSSDSRRLVIQGWPGPFTAGHTCGSAFDAADQIDRLGWNPNRANKFGPSIRWRADSFARASPSQPTSYVKHAADHCRSTCRGLMKPTRSQLRTWTAGLTLAVMPLISVALAPSSAAQVDCALDPNFVSCQPAMGGGMGGPMNPNPQAGWTQPGDLVIPATGGPPQVAVAPAPPGAPVVTGGGGLVIPGAPPIP